MRVGKKVEKTRIFMNKNIRSKRFVFCWMVKKTAMTAWNKWNEIVIDTERNGQSHRRKYVRKLYLGNELISFDKRMCSGSRIVCPLPHDHEIYASKHQTEMKQARQEIWHERLDRPQPNWRTNILEKLTPSFWGANFTLGLTGQFSKPDYPAGSQQKQIKSIIIP